MSTDVKDRVPGAVGSREKVPWPEWVEKMVRRSTPVKVDGVGSAGYEDNDRVMLILTAEDKIFHHFDMSRSTAKTVIRMLTHLTED